MRLLLSNETVALCRRAIRFAALAGLLGLWSLPSNASEESDLAKESQNPIGDIISLPFENNTSFGTGPEDGVINALNLKPVYPLDVGSWNLINRGIFPLVYQGERFAGEGSVFGLGDFTYQGFFTPPASGPITWGFGPALVFPTHTDDRLGQDKWSAGPAVVALTKPGPWLVGGLFTHVWSYAGDDDDPDVNLSSFQYFLNYNFDSGWYLTSSPTITANWSADGSDRWTVPVGGGAGKVVRLGQQPVDLKGQFFWNAVGPDDAADLTIQFQVKFLFPK